MDGPFSLFREAGFRTPLEGTPWQGVFPYMGVGFPSLTAAVLWARGGPGTFVGQGGGGGGGPGTFVGQRWGGGGGGAGTCMFVGRGGGGGGGYVCGPPNQTLCVTLLFLVAI